MASHQKMSSLVCNVANLLQKCRVPGSFRHCSALHSDDSSSVKSPIISFPDFSHTSSRAPSEPRQAFVESLSHTHPVGLISLHPEIFGRMPLLHVVRDNIYWQESYRNINYEHEKNKVELTGGGRKPWPQKGGGRARHGSVRSPIFFKGGSAKGPRRFTTKFFMLNTSKRILGLTSMLSAKFAQDDIKVIESLDLTSPDSDNLEQLMDDRVWGPSILFVDVEDFMPENITLATDKIAHYNIMPVYGLNVFSMVKHNTLVLTVAAVRKLEEKLLEAIYSPTSRFDDEDYKKRLSLDQ